MGSGERNARHAFMSRNQELCREKPAPMGPLGPHRQAMLLSRFHHPQTPHPQVGRTEPEIRPRGKAPSWAEYRTGRWE